MYSNDALRMTTRSMKKDVFTNPMFVSVYSMGNPDVCQPKTPLSKSEMEIFTFVTWKSFCEFYKSLHEQNYRTAYFPSMNLAVERFKNNYLVKTSDIIKMNYEYNYGELYYSARFKTKLDKIRFVKAIIDEFKRSYSYVLDNIQYFEKP